MASTEQTAQHELRIQDLHVSVDGKPIVKGLDLTIRSGEIHGLMGPNGSGKTTLAFALMGHPRYSVERGQVLLDGEDVLSMSPDERARRGLFLAFQYPAEVQGVTVANFLRTAVNSVHGALTGKDMPIAQFQKLLQEKMQLLEMDRSFAARYLNEGFSGGEKKRNEMLQMAMLRPKIAVLDETDSGLDIDAIKVVARAVNSLRGPDFGALVITHYQRILRYIVPDVVHVMVDGQIVRSGGKELAELLEQKGYDWIRQEVAAQRGAR
ncbi:Fe-S cluster assembly ATPase SufC [Carboxydochorda subterranea]|uniref:Fe-S cluster assembly ATPase SufC n=1 Tax=Carboxydichorda subterranea TaxID=3109565 RepID=A0ABZ1C199_9FIRM|nr:Fe-S cluster assembly ATPase SufC [Limnochorda sp. L945t]WRP18635.1 Fe-S cluster assembly ATPase SufC [Limnochorda sp. L945t]